MTPEIAGTISAVVALVALAGGSLFSAGRTSGRFERHESAVEKRLDKLEDEQRSGVTRHEMEARFDALGDQISDLKKLIQQTIGR